MYIIPTYVVDDGDRCGGGGGECGVGIFLLLLPLPKVYSVILLNNKKAWTFIYTYIYIMYVCVCACYIRVGSDLKVAFNADPGPSTFPQTATSVKLMIYSYIIRLNFRKAYTHTFARFYKHILFPSTWQKKKI